MCRLGRGEGNSTSDPFQKQHYEVHRGQWKLAKASRRNWLLHWKSRPVTDGLAFLKSNQLLQAGQGLTHPRADILERGVLDSMLKELTGKGGVGSEDRVTAECRFIVKAVVADG